MKCDHVDNESSFTSAKPINIASAEFMLGEGSQHIEIPPLLSHFQCQAPHGTRSRLQLGVRVTRLSIIEECLHSLTGALRSIFDRKNFTFRRENIFFHYLPMRQSRVTAQTLTSCYGLQRNVFSSFDYIKFGSTSEEAPRDGLNDDESETFRGS